MNTADSSCKNHASLEMDRWWLCSYSCTGKGILKLYDDVQMCGYQDVQVMWEILTKPEMETPEMESPKRLKQRKGSIWRLSSCCRRTRFSLMQWKPISETVDEKGKQSLAMSWDHNKERWLYCLARLRCTCTYDIYHKPLPSTEVEEGF